jgi:hypothetical protein
MYTFLNDLPFNRPIHSFSTRTDDWTHSLIDSIKTGQKNGRRNGTDCLTLLRKAPENLTLTANQEIARMEKASLLQYEQKPATGP